MVTCPRQIPVRWVTGVMGSLGFLIIYGLRVNMSVAVLAMVNHTAFHPCTQTMNNLNDTLTLPIDMENFTEFETTVSPSMCYLEHGENEQEDGPFVWDENIQGLVLASYFYGYIFTQILGGWLGEKFSAKHVYGTGVLINAVATILSPPGARWSYMALMALRVVSGAAAGMTLPAMHALLSKWVPPPESSKISSTVYAGTTLGTLIYLPFTGILASELGWEWVFYIQGFIAIVWYLFWLILISDSPDEHPIITIREKTFINNSLGNTGGQDVVKRPPLPLREVIKSKPVWGIIIAHTCNNWGWYMLLVKLPTYMKHILHFDIKANSALSALPYTSMWMFTIILANILDYLRGKGIITTTTARKFSTFLASIPPGICLVCLTFVGNTTMVIALLTLGMTFLGGIFSGFLTNHIDIAPPYAGTLLGISNTFATIPGILVSSVVSYMTHNNQTIYAWRNIFYITMGVFTVECLAFTLLGSGEKQSWAKTKKTPESERLPID